jgi:hypothetical protein
MWDRRAEEQSKCRWLATPEAKNSTSGWSSFRVRLLVDRLTIHINLDISYEKLS